MTNALPTLLEKAIHARSHLFDEHHETAFRLFNGFYEGYPDLVLDVYGRTLVVHDRADESAGNTTILQESVALIRRMLPWLHAGILKTRNAKTQDPSPRLRAGEKQGQHLFGKAPDRKIREHGIWYDIDLSLNQDASFYLDTRNLRKWLSENVRGMSVLNTFAYTGSLGVAAKAGGASRVVQTDHNRAFLNLAKDSYSLNGFPIHKADFVAQDFFPAIARFKATGQRFDCVILDPPFFSTTSRGRVDLAHDSARLINKVRPLINGGGLLVVINNALYVSGVEYMRTLEGLCRDGYLKIRELIPVPQDFIGYETAGVPVTDPAPFNHSTKIAILDVRRKS